MTTPRLDVDVLWSLPRVGSPEPAPDGTFVVVPVTTYDMEANEGSSRLWRVSVDGGQAQAITSADAKSSQPAISPDGNRLAFIRKVKDGKQGKGNGAAGSAKHPDKAQLYLMPLDGGEAERLTDLPLGASSPSWFPDGKRIAFLSPVYRDAPTLESTADRAAQIDDEPVKARVTEDRVYRYWDHWLTDADVRHVFAIDLETREVMDLTPSLQGWMPFMSAEGQYTISPDGSEIAFTAMRSAPPYDPLVWGVYTAAVPVAIGADAVAGQIELLTVDHPAHAFRPAYSPDGRWLLYGIQRELDFYADRQRLVVYDREKQTHSVLTEDWDVNYASDWRFVPGTSTVVLTAEMEARGALFSFDIEAAVRDASARTPAEIARGGWFTAPRIAGGRVFTTLQAIDQPPEVASCALDGAGLQMLTTFTAPGLVDVPMGAIEETSFVGAEGDTVQMFLVYPPDTPLTGDGRPQEPLPLVHMIHGGPHGSFGDQWHWRWSAQSIAAAGYLVALVNFHGSTGWGQDYAASILGRWGDQPYIDIMAATDALIERGLADPDRMAATGGSYGGYLVSWIAGQTDRFKCLINHAGVCDFQTQYASDITQGRARSMGGEPWDNIEGMDTYNPMRHAAGFSSPMLVIHGEKDYRVPYDQGIAIYNVYKAKGLPARLVCYPDENHWILKPRNSQHWYGEFLGWLDRWLGKGDA